MCYLCASGSAAISASLNTHMTSAKAAQSGQVSWSLERIADHLAQGLFGKALAYNVGTSGVITYDISALSAPARSAAVTALNTWSAMSAVTFKQGSTGASDIRFTAADPSGAHGGTTSWRGELIKGYVNIPNDWNYGNTALTSYYLQTFIHEIGHALGFGHAGNYNTGITYGVNTLFKNDSWSTTVMSYFHQDANPHDPAQAGYAITPMPADILAIQSLYGRGSNEAGNTTWGPGGNVKGYGPNFQKILDMWGGLIPVERAIYNDARFVFTIHDTGGIDTLNGSVFKMAQKLDLRGDAFSDMGGRIGNVVLSKGTVIENAIGGAGNDKIYGNTRANSLSGNDGADQLFGGAGNDTLTGGRGADILNGGDGRDAASYLGSNTGVRVDLRSGLGQNGHAAGDRLSAIESLIGSNHADYLAGNHLANGLAGKAGADHLLGFGGNDTLWGDGGADRLEGGAGDDQLFGGSGNDVLHGGPGADLLNGGAGRDRVTYFFSPGAVEVDLRNPIGRRGEAQGDRLVSIEDISGSAFSDRLIGNAANNMLEGHNGHDTLLGYEGADRLFGGAGNDRLEGGKGSDTLTGGSGADVFVFHAGHDVITDFQNNIDTIAISRDISGPRGSVSNVLAAAKVINGDIVLAFGSADKLTLKNFTDIHALRDDMIFI